MDSVLLTQLVLFAVAITGWLIGRGIHAFFVRRADDASRYAAELPRMSDTIAFISGAVGILLGLLLSFSVGNYQDAQASVKEYASSVNAAYQASDMFPAAAKTEVQKDLICSVKAFVANDRGPQINNRLNVSEQASLWMAKLNDDLKTLPTNTAVMSQSFPILLQSTIDMSHWRELILLTSLQSIPIVIWFVIYVSVFFLAVLLTLHLADKKGLGWVSFGVAYLTLAVIIYALTVLDYPLHNFGFGSAISTDTLIETVKASNLRLAASYATICQHLTPAVLVAP
jgi:hypothetical protein